MPVSLTLRITPLSVSSKETVIEPPSLLYLMALETRFSISSNIIVWSAVRVAEPSMVAVMFLLCAFSESPSNTSLARSWSLISVSVLLGASPLSILESISISEISEPRRRHAFLVHQNFGKALHNGDGSLQLVGSVGEEIALLLLN